MLLWCCLCVRRTAHDGRRRRLFRLLEPGTIRLLQWYVAIVLIIIVIIIVNVLIVIIVDANLLTN